MVVRKFVDFVFNWGWDRDPEGLGVFGKVDTYVLSDPDHEPQEYVFNPLYSVDHRMKRFVDLCHRCPTGGTDSRERWLTDNNFVRLFDWNSFG